MAYTKKKKKKKKKNRKQISHSKLVTSLTCTFVYLDSYSNLSSATKEVSFIQVLALLILLSIIS